MGRAGAWLKAKAPRLHRFLTRRDRPWPLVREGLAAVLVIALLLGGLYGLTGQPIRGGYPVVVVTTGSMMHCEEALPTSGGPQFGKDCTPTSWGRIGTIDPGDLVFVRAIDESSDVETAAEADGATYGKDGDVIVYRPGGSASRVPIIHRALFWVEVRESDGRVVFDVPALGIFGAADLSAPEVQRLTQCVGGGSNLTSLFRDRYQAMRHADPANAAARASGFVTKGDNNGYADACTADPGVAHLEWVLGKARGEVPWIGLVNLLWGDLTGGTNNYGNAGGDSKVMFFVTIAVLVTLPWAIEMVLRRRRRRKAEREEETEKEEEP